MIFPIIISLLSTVTICFTLFQGDLISGHDIAAHLIRSQLFHESLTSGQFPVRWVDGILPAMGNPQFQFYPPLFYYLSSFFQLFGVNYIHAAYGIVILSFLLGWWFMYLFVRYHLGNLPALFAASIYTLSPYRFSQLYVRAALPEILASALIPLAFWGVSLLFSKRKYLAGIILTSFSIALLSLSHQPTLFMTLIPLLFWFCFYLFVTQTLKPIKYLGLSILFTLGLIAFFIFPLLAQQKYIDSSNLTSSYYSFKQHFATISQIISSPWNYGVSQAGENDSMSFGLGTLNLFLIFGSLLFYFLLPAEQHIFLLFSAITLIFSLLMMLPSSQPLWQRFSPLQYIQYPWRFLIIATFASSLIAAPFIKLMNKNTTLSQIVLFSLFWIILPLSNLNHLKPATFLDSSTYTLATLRQPNSKPLETFFDVEPGYLPISQEKQDLNLTATASATVLNGQAQITLSPSTPSQKVYSIIANGPSVVRFPIRHFPGWTVVGHSAVSSYPLAYTVAPNSFLDVTLPPNTTKVVFTFKSTPIRQVSDFISLITFLFFLYLLLTHILLPLLPSKHTKKMPFFLRPRFNLK